MIQIPWSTAFSGAEEVGWYTGHEIPGQKQVERTLGPKQNTPCVGDDGKVSELTSTLWAPTSMHWGEKIGEKMKSRRQPAFVVRDWVAERQATGASRFS